MPIQFPGPDHIHIFNHIYTVDLINPCEICPYKLSGPINGGFLKCPNMGVPQNECFIVSNGNSMKILVRWMIWGYHQFLGNLHMVHIHIHP